MNQGVFSKSVLRRTIHQKLEKYADAMLEELKEWITGKKTGKVKIEFNFGQGGISEVRITKEEKM